MSSEIVPLTPNILQEFLDSGPRPIFGRAPDGFSSTDLVPWMPEHNPQRRIKIKKRHGYQLRADEDISEWDYDFSMSEDDMFDSARQAIDGNAFNGGY